MSYGLGTYKKTSIETASKEQILLMLYQAAIRNCKKAIENTEKKNIAKKGENISKLQGIVIELNNSLNFKTGENLANELSSLYDFILYTSTQANINLDPAPLRDCLKILNTLYEGWREAIKSLDDEKNKSKENKTSEF